MFTGLVETTGVVVARTPQGEGADLTVAVPLYAGDLALGESVSVNGVCLSVVAQQGVQFTANVIAETLRRTTVGSLQPGAVVDLERALRAGDRLGGHLVAGHIDGVAEVIARESADYGEAVDLELPADLARYVAPKGSIALDGISLTVGEVWGARFRVYLIPHTLAVTVAGQWRPGVRVNVEVDVISRYVERLLAGAAEATAVTRER